MLHRLEFQAMGCEILVLMENGSDIPPEEFSLVPDRFEDWEQTLSRFRLDSELSRLNQTFDQPVRVSQTLWDVFQACLQADQSTDGLVTPTVLDAVIDSGYGRPFDELPGYRMGAHSSLLTDVRPLSQVIWEENERTICLPPGLHLDLGGVAKGWAAHQAAERLKQFGSVLVDAAGDIAISGPLPTGEAWKIGVANPFQPGDDLITLCIKRGGVATSGKDRRRWVHAGTLYHHIIDPRTSQSAETDVLTATVIAPTVMQAEAVAKSIFILGSQAGLEWLGDDPTLACLLILDNGLVHVSRQMEAYL